MNPSPAADADILPDLAACVLLVGGPRPSPLSIETGCSVLDLSITPTRTVLGVWIERLTEICPASRPRLELRVVHDEQTPEPILLSDPGPLEVRIDHEQRSYRGPAGITRDECADLRPEETVLVVEGGRLAGCSLAPMLRRHAASGADITVGANPDGSTSGLYVLRVGSLDLVPGVGFMDLKEQWLQKALTAGLLVGVFRNPDPGALALRTRLQLLGAVQIINGFPGPLDSMMDCPGNPKSGGRDGRSIISETATVAPGAVVTDSVVMHEATVAAGAVVVRSLICPRAVVGAEMRVIDGVVTRNGVGLSAGTGKAARWRWGSSQRKGDGRSE